MNNVVIISATRTAVGKFGGTLKDFTLGQLGSVVLKEALTRANIGSGEVNEVIRHPNRGKRHKKLVTFLHELQQRKGTYGLSTLCIGGGQVIALVVKR